MVARRGHRPAQCRESGPAGYGLVEPAPPVRTRSGPCMALRSEPASWGSASDRPHPRRPHGGADAGHSCRTIGHLCVILYRCFAWDERARDNQPDGPLWFPRVFQGEGRHDNPDIYGCLYLADRAFSSVVEQLARFRGQRLTPALLRRRGLPLGLAELELAG